MTTRRSGAADQRARATLAALVASGSATCYRCGQPIHPTDQWDTDHPDPLITGGNPAGPVTPSHASCNRSHGAAIGNRARRGRTRPEKWRQFFPATPPAQHPEMSVFSPPKPHDSDPTRPDPISPNALVRRA